MNRLLTGSRNGRQLCLFDNPKVAMQLDDLLWCNSFDRQSSSLHALALHSSKIKPGIAQVLIEQYSQPGEIVLDPFAGSGTIPLETLLSERQAWASDLNPYGWALTQGKLAAPRSDRLALQQAATLMDQVEQQAAGVDLAQIPSWIHDFFHPDTLRETIAAFQVFQTHPFFTACLLGILHHVSASGLSYPTRPESPFLRRSTYPPEAFPQLYAYRDVRSRLIAKIRRTYRNHCLPPTWDQRQYQVWQANCQQLSIAAGSVDAIITQPPHTSAFNYVRDHRLRLWFLGQEHWQPIDDSLISGGKLYLAQMSLCLQEMARVLPRDRPCILVTSDLEQHGKRRGTAELLANLATEQQFIVEMIYDNYPQILSRSATKAIPVTRILVLRKSQASVT
jgi:hypothetical protein